MKVRIQYTVVVDRTVREEINRHYGRNGLASREEVRDWFEAFGHAMTDDLYMNADERENDK